MRTALFIILLVIPVLGGPVYLYAVYSDRLAAAEQRASHAEEAASSLREQLEGAKTSEHVVTQYVDRVQLIHEQGATITREIPVYVSAQADTACTVPHGFVSVHDAAAEATALPSPAGTTDAASSGLALSTVAGTVADNYTTCHATSAQLTALQDWVRANSQQTP